MMTRLLSILVAAGLVATAALNVRAQSRQEKREAKITESGQPQSVKGGITFQVSVPYDKAYEAVLNQLKRQGYTIEASGKETGQIITAMDIKGGYTQTGTRVQVTCIKDGETQTSIRVAVTEQKRKKLLQTEPWGDPKVNEQASSKVADEIRSAVGAAT
jgi:hypothetical protein